MMVNVQMPYVGNPLEGHARVVNYVSSDNLSKIQNVTLY